MNFETVLPTVNDLLAFGAGGLLTSLLLIIGHWTPTPLINDRLPRTTGALLARYTYGTLSLWLGALLWLSLIGHWQLALGLMGLNIIGGSVVVLVYTWDSLYVAVRRSKLIEHVDEELSRQ